jgi:hypothetical protein
LIELFEEENSQLDEGTLPPDLPSVFVSPGGVIDLLMEILETIEGEDLNYGNLFAEYRLDKITLGQDASGRPVLLTGMIDRVDGNREDRQKAIIVDYKTGRPPEPKELRIKVGDGRMLQLPLYAAALQIRHSDLKVIGAAYVHLNEKARSHLIGASEAIVAIGELLPKKKEDEKELLNTQAALDLAIHFASQIRAGHFQLTSHGPGLEEAECTAYCPLRHACRHPEGYTSSNRNW